MASERPTCETCPYWEETPFTDDWGLKHCKRHSPSPVLYFAIEPMVSANDEDRPINGRVPYWDATNSIRANWPTTDEDDWCGEHPDFPAWLAERNSSRAAGVAPDFVVPRDWQHLSIRAITALEKLIGDRERLPVAEVDGEIPWYVRGCGVTTKREILEWLAERKEGKGS